MLQKIKMVLDSNQEAKMYDLANFITVCFRMNVHLQKLYDLKFNKRKKIIECSSFCPEIVIIDTA